jgi:glyoxylase-like metal-dependent hydrolase (beta-lactamase superfamily II)
VTRLRTTNPVASHRLAQDPLSAAARHEVAVGRLTVAAISDGVLVMSPTMVGSPAYPTAAHDELAARYGEARLPLGCFVLSGEQIVLIDTGIGPVDHAGRGTLVGGNLLGRLASLGVAPADIDVVALSHLHGDHVGTLGDLQTGQPVFPNATILVGAGDWTYFVANDQAPMPLAGYVRQALVEQCRRGMVWLTDDDINVVPGLRRVATPGHTPGHSVYVVEDQGQRLYLAGDSMHTPQQVAHPDWAVPFDVDPDQAREVRDWLAGEVGRPGTVGVLGCHFPNLWPVSI